MIVALKTKKCLSEASFFLFSEDHFFVT